MFSLKRSSRRPVALLLALAASTIALTAGGRQVRVPATARVAPTVRVTPTPRPPVSCATPEFRQFDFFAGDWDTYDVADPSKVVARNRVTVVLDGCAVREVYQQNDGLVGESPSLYDATRRGWHQSCVEVLALVAWVAAPEVALGILLGPLDRRRSGSRDRAARTAPGRCRARAAAGMMSASRFRSHSEYSLWSAETG